MTALDISTGLMVHTMLAALGPGVILQASEWLFLVVKINGVAYRVYLGVRMILSASDSIALLHGGSCSLRRLFFDGAFTNFTNPKIAVLIGLGVNLALERRA